MLRRLRARALVVAAGCVGAAPGTVAQSPPEAHLALAGRLALSAGGRAARDRGLDLRQAAVWYEPARRTERAAPVHAEMTTHRKQFSPQLLVVPVGSTVRFPNSDPILHNVFSVSGKNAFDLGLVGAGAGKAATFRESGLVRVFCNVHHAMFAHVLVVGTPHFVQPDRDGRFRLDGLAAGAGTLHFWHERAEAASRRVVLPYPGELQLELEASVPRVPPHKNKFGRSYTRGAYD